MKKLQLWIAFVIPLLLYSCINDPGLEHEPAPPPTDKLLTVGEARAYFEQQITHETRSGHARSTFLPENFTPEWNDAIQAENGKVTRVDVPIRSNTRLRALRSEYTDCAAQPYIVDVAVKLVVLQKFGLKSHLSQYLMLLVPDRAYYANHKNGMDEIVPESDDMKNYSGYAIYYQLYSNKPSYISKYSKGGIVEHLGLTNEQEGYEERVKQMQIILSQIRFAKSSCVQTRIGGEIDEVIIYGCGNCRCSPCQCGNQPYPTEPSGCSNCGCDPCQCSNDACSACQSNPCQCHNNNTCPFCGNDSCGGACAAGGSGSGGSSSGNNNDDDKHINNDSESGSNSKSDNDTNSNKDPINDDKDSAIENKKISTAVTNLLCILGNKVTNIVNYATFKIGLPAQNTLASSTMKYQDIFDQTSTITIIVKMGLTDIQQHLILAHECMHLVLIEVSRNAGSESALSQTNQELFNDIRQDGVNEGHHKYMGGHIDQVEQLLRSAFPGQDEDFYEYGKWGGGAMNSDEFTQLPKYKQHNTEVYLKKHDLLK